MRVVGYIRVSTDEQASSGLGITAQRSAITDECERRGWELVEIVANSGVSDKSMVSPSGSGVLLRWSSPAKPKP